MSTSTYEAGFFRAAPTGTLYFPGCNQAPIYRAYLIRNISDPTERTMRMRYLLATAKFIGLLFGISIVFALCSVGIGVGDTLIFCAAVAMAALGFLIKGDWIPRQVGVAGCVAVLIASVLSFAALFPKYQAEKDAELAKMRAERPSEYLEFLKNKEGKDSDTYLQQLKEIDPKAYVSTIESGLPKDLTGASVLPRLEMIKPLSMDKYNSLIEKRNRQIAEKENLRAARIEELSKKVLSVPASSVQKNIDYYKELSELDPDNARFRNKLAHYMAKKREIADMRNNPEKYVKIADFSWWKGGFDNVMMINISIKNNLSYDIKDISIRCEHSTESGTNIDYNTAAIYKVFPAKKTKSIKDFNMGFIHSQAARTYCKITSLERRY